MRQAPILKSVTLLLLLAITSTANYSQATKSKKSSSGDNSSSNGDQSGPDGTEDGSGGTKDKTGGNDASKSEDKSKGDTSKTGFDDGTYAEATAITYKAMQAIASEIAAERDTTANTFVVFDPTTFANIAQYRITFPQVVLLRTSLCGALSNMDGEKDQEKKAREQAGVPTTIRPEYGAGASIAGLTPAGQIVDLAQKVLTMLQTTTTIAGASVNVTDEALVAEVAAHLVGVTPKPAVYYPGEFLLPDIGEKEINSAMTDSWCAGGQPLGESHHIVAEVVRLGVAREEAASRYQLLTAALDKYNSIFSPSAKKQTTDTTDKTVRTDKTEKMKKKARGVGGASATSPAPAAPAADVDATQAHVPTAKEKADALDQFFAETGFTDAVKATGYQANLKSYMDAYDALLTSLATPDTKGQSTFSRLVVAERLNAILKPPTVPDPNDAKKTSTVPIVNVVVVKWLRAGALNKTRKNLFFLGQRNYYAGGATALYEYFDGDQKMVGSGTITATSPYVHDKEFDKGKIGTMIDLSKAKATAEE